MAQAPHFKAPITVTALVANTDGYVSQMAKWCAKKVFLSNRYLKWQDEIFVEFVVSYRFFIFF